MLFNSIEFIFCFLPIAYLGYVFLQKWSKSAALSYLTAASFFFYAWWDLSALPILCSSIIINYLIGYAIVETSELKQKRKSLLLSIGVSANISALVYYKYVGFIIAQMNLFPGLEGSFHLNAVSLPIGISFFTFTQIAFLVDARLNKCGEYNPLHYALFVSYFPHLIAGPILHHSEMMPQFKNAKIISIFSGEVCDGLALFGVGLAKKLLLADAVGFYADKFFGGVQSGAEFAFFEALFGALSYTFQLYFDFSGYSDMAVGISRMFGVELPLNFNSPYKSCSVIEFWRRWHISLSRFLRDYLYISLGGNRRGATRRYANLIITMLIGGAWHGAGWTFIVWGGLHGIYLAINHLWKIAVQKVFPWAEKSKTIHFSGFVLTFSVVVLAWIPFRSSTLGDAIKIYEALCGANGYMLPDQILKIFPALSLFVAGSGTVPLLADGTVMGFVDMTFMIAVCCFVTFLFKNSNEMNHKNRLILASLCLPLVVQRIAFGAKAEFLYFQF